MFVQTNTSTDHQLHGPIRQDSMDLDQEVSHTPATDTCVPQSTFPEQQPAMTGSCALDGAELNNRQARSVSPAAHSEMPYVHLLICVVYCLILEKSGPLRLLHSHLRLRILTSPEVPLVHLDAIHLRARCLTRQMMTTWVLAKKKRRIRKTIML